MTNFNKIEQAYHLLLDTTQTLQNQLHTHAYDALIEQNVLYVTGEDSDGLIKANHHTLRSLALSKEEWRKVFQFMLMKLARTEPLQANHHFTPDTIGFIILFLIETLSVRDKLSVLELGSGTGFLAQTLLNHTVKDMTYVGIELDDLLIDLSASMADVMGLSARFVQGDAVRPLMLSESDIVISDLPIGYYPNDTVARRYQVASPTAHTYVHHLLMEQALKYLKSDGFAIFLGPSQLLTSQQGHLLSEWLQTKASIIAVIALPDEVFNQKEQAKSLFVLTKKSPVTFETFVYPLKSLTNPSAVKDFMENLKKWKQESDIFTENLI